MRLGPATAATAPCIAMGFRPLCVTAEDRLERQPLETPRHLLVASVRLDNREALQRDLRLEGVAMLPDSAVLLAAYEKWGAACFDRLMGDWCCAIWDKAARTLLLARDATGNSGLFWWRDGNTVVFATALVCVAAHPDVPRRPNELVVGCFLARFDDPETEGATFFAGVQCVLPGATVAVDASGAAHQRWWNPEALAPLNWRDVRQYDEAFLALYREAVECRLRRAQGKKVGLALSAGLDSGSVMALAAPALALQGEPLHGYVYRPMGGGGQYGPGNVDDEFDQACEAAQFVGNVQVSGMCNTDSSWLAGIEASQQVHGEPSISAGSYYWLADMMQRVSGDAVSVLLTGQGGNGSVSWSGTGNVWPQLRRGALLSVYQQLRGSLLPFRKALRVQLLSPMRQRVRRRVLGSRFAPAPDWAEQSLIHPDLVQSLDLQSRMRGECHDLAHRPPYSERQLKIWRLDASFGNSVGSRWLDMGSMFGVDVRDPTRDRRVVEFCWRAPDPVFWGDASQRTLIRRGFQGRLPSDMLQRRSRGLQSADITLRFDRERPEIEEWISAHLQNTQANRWIDVGLLRKRLLDVQNCDAATTYHVLFSQIAPALSLLMFIERNRWP